MDQAVHICHLRTGNGEAATKLEVKCNSCQEESTRKLIKMNIMHFEVCWSCFNMVTKHYIYLSHLSKLIIPTTFLSGPIYDRSQSIFGADILHICMVIFYNNQVLLWLNEMFSCPATQVYDM